MFFFYVNESDKTLMEDLRFEMTGLMIEGCPPDKREYSVVVKPKSTNFVSLTFTGDDEITLSH